MEPRIQYAKPQADVHIACAAPSAEPSLVTACIMNSGRKVPDVV